MPFSSNPLLAPVFQSPVGDGRDHRPPVVSIKRAEDAVESGIRLHHNQRVEGYILQPEVEGLGVAPVEVQTAALASGGSVARHTRFAEGDVFLPITLVSPVPSALPGMFDALVDIVRPGQRDEDGLPLQFEVVVFDPYGQETRSRRLIFESGLGDPVRVNHHVWRTSITGRFVDPFWYGQVRELRRTLGSVDKKFITAKEGNPDQSADVVTHKWADEQYRSPSERWVNEEFAARNLVHNPRFQDGLNSWNPTAWTSQYFSVDTTDGELWDGVSDPMVRVDVPSDHTANSDLDMHVMDVQPGQWVAISAYVAQAGESGTIRYQYRIARADGSWSYPHSPITDIEGGKRFTTVGQVPGASDGGYMQLRVSFRDQSDQGNTMFATRFMVAVADSEQAALDQVAEFFDGDSRDVTPQVGGYEFPFFPVRIGGSVVQGEYELQVEGDAPAYWSGVITPPGEDLLIQNAKGERIFVQGRVDEPILIQTRPQEQDITLADGTPIWDRIDPGDDDFFPLHPGRNTVHVSMVGATQQSEILIRYREAFYHSLGGGR